MGGVVAQWEAWQLNWEAWQLNGRRGSSMGGVVAQGRRGSSMEAVVAQWQRARLLSCSPGFESGVSPAHSCLPISWWVATWDGTWLRADLCEGQQWRKLRKRNRWFTKNIQRKKKLGLMNKSIGCSQVSCTPPLANNPTATCLQNSVSAGWIATKYIVRTSAKEEHTVHLRLSVQLTLGQPKGCVQCLPHTLIAETRTDLAAVSNPLFPSSMPLLPRTERFCQYLVLPQFSRLQYGSTDGQLP